MTEHPGEQFPPDVDPDVEPGFEPNPAEDSPAGPDYDTEPGPQSFSHTEQPAEAEYAEAPAAAEHEQPAEAEYEAPGEVEYGEDGGHVGRAEVEFGPEFARAPGEEHEHSFVAESAEPQDEGGHPLVEETMSRLDELRDRPVSEHGEVYADLHERLQSALVEADAEPGDRA